ncbi:MAG: TonB-dependent receptor [Planctomycetes bacterium]|nr:TonB-dependent receptor [Planctomycetota bacterium]
MLTAGAINWAQEDDFSDLTLSDSLFENSLADLMTLDVYSAGRHLHSQQDVASAIHVITSEDIKRSGATNIPDTLKMVPGLNVAQSNSHKWAISARGFQSYLSAKLLVMIDGRTIYLPYASVVEWKFHDIVLDDIDRIEVILGPGASLWGANAVNGVINILTKKAGESQGGYVSLGAGIEERAFGEVRYGDRTSLGHYRISSKYAYRDGGVSVRRYNADSDNMGEDAPGDWTNKRVSFRFDGHENKTGELMVQGDYFMVDAHELQYSVNEVPSRVWDRIPMESKSKGGSLLASWATTLQNLSELKVQFFYDHVRGESINENANLDTVDFEIQHHIETSHNNSLIYGLGYRHSWDELESVQVRYEPEKSRQQKLNMFVQDEFVFAEKFILTAGAKIEHHDDANWEFQPNLRLLYKLKPNHRLWTSVSRAVRTPSRLEKNIRADSSPIPDMGYVRLTGNEDIESEELISYELGYRGQLSERLNLNIAAYYNDYDNLILLTSEKNVGEPFFEDGYVIIPVVVNNVYKGKVYGGEVSLNYDFSQSLRLSASYSYVYMDVDGSENSTSEMYSTPKNSIVLRSLWNVNSRFKFDSALYYISGVDFLKTDTRITADSQCTWKVKEDLSLSAVVQNVFDDKNYNHYEPTFGHSAEMERRIFAKITASF